VLPDGRPTTVKGITTPQGPVEVAEVGLSVAVDLADDLDVSRGEMIVGSEAPPEVTNDLTATVCWFSPTPLVPGRRLRVKHTTRSTPGIVAELVGELNVTTLHVGPAAELSENSIGIVRLTTATPLVVDHYSVNRVTGSFVLIDEVTNITVAAGMVGPPTLRTD
jgi:bifunctional enzyme CysN/CysC